MSVDRLLGVRLDPRPLPVLLAHIGLDSPTQLEPFVFACANPHSLRIARIDPEFRLALDAANAVVADGVGCKWGALLAGVSIGPRITGYEFFSSTMAALNQKGGKVFFLGARDNSLSKIVARATTDYPRLIVATLSPPFGQWSPDENGQILRSIRDFQPDILWVGMTAPKQEKWVAANLSQLNTHLIGSIGAVFDYYAGVTPRAPQWICNLGVEWLYRLPREPLRLWRRTVVSAPLFLWFSFLQRLRK